MYQDKIEAEATEAVNKLSMAKKNYNVFEKNALLPLTFEPDEDIEDQTYIARDILSNRGDAEIITISNGINYMQKLGSDLAESLYFKMRKENTNRTSMVITEGRMLYLLCDYFDLSSININKLLWGEIFATLTLMQSAEVNALVSIKNTEPQNEFEQALIVTADIHIQEQKEEIIDSIARAECLFDKKVSAVSVAKAGGNAKAKNIKPLKDEVIHRYMKNYSLMSNITNRAAGKEILKSLDKENNKLLLLSYADDKAHQFSKWIALANDKELKITIKNQPKVYRY